MFSSKIARTVAIVRRSSFRGFPTAQLHSQRCCRRFSSISSDDGTAPQYVPSAVLKNPALAGLKVEGVKNADMWIVYTCKKCEVRSVKGMTRHAYEKGLVIVRCPGCEALHLIADNIGWFPEDGSPSQKFSVEDTLRLQGQAIKSARVDGLASLTPEELADLISTVKSELDDGCSESKITTSSENARFHHEHAPDGSCCNEKH
ncbi:mitochondrial DNL zinc finger protein 1 [Andalucia godoyi]|uniref:Mitochondrial DNL zinc finger protein 1 n=1 Tax=Andalucia godoyi TaxID=505711 RepID=A0A8K0F291_ANDGO|nr:mitochondrial DNL zinc finger protein 1 [Andalucia godoyi]|eukprot:ANDGO_06382.mRNA.1 mitochondrial DNL zinc finger protein 1